MPEEAAVGFNDSTEVRKYLGGVFEVAFADPEIGPKLKDTGIVLKTVYSDPNSVIIIDCVNGTVSEGSADAASTAEMAMSAETGNAYWQGKVNLPMAMAKSRIKVGGNVASLLKLAPLGKKLFPRYIQMLTDDGRTDLVV
jgi:SCP-2 sterol transfer family